MTTENIWIVSATYYDDGDVYHGAARTREELRFALERAIRAAYDTLTPARRPSYQPFFRIVNAIPSDLPDLDVIERAWPLGSPSLRITLVEVASAPDAEEST